MTRERRLGRGLEALLGKVAAQQPDEAADGEFERSAFSGRPSSHGLEDQAGGFATDREQVLEQQRLATADREEESSMRNPVPEEEPEIPPQAASPSGPPSRIDIRQIDSNPFQPRQDFGDAEIDSLADSLRSHGLLQPLVVRRMGDRYQLVAGERRLRAAARAGWTEVPIQLIDADDRQTAELAIVENLQRKDLNALEKAASFQRYLDQYGCTQEDLATRLKIDRSTVANLIRLLELPDRVQEAVRQGRITQGHARALLPLGDEREQLGFCDRIQAEGLSVRKTEALVQEVIQAADSPPLGVVDEEGVSRPVRRTTSEHVSALEQEFRAALGLRVSITHNSRGKGKLVIHFAGHDDFQRLRNQLCDVPENSLESRAG